MRTAHALTADQWRESVEIDVLAPATQRGCGQGIGELTISPIP